MKAFGSFFLAAAVSALAWGAAPAVPGTLNYVEGQVSTGGQTLVLRSGVTVTGWLSSADVAKQLAQCTVFLHTALYEGSPFVLLDAAASTAQEKLTIIRFEVVDCTAATDCTFAIHCRLMFR